MKNRRFAVAAIAALFVVSVITPVAARSDAARQAEPPGPPSARQSQGSTAPPPVTLRVTVTISRWDGEKRLSNAPYVLMVVPSYGAGAEAGRDGDATTLQIGSQVAVPTTSEGKPSWTYRSVGTNISVAARPLITGQFNVWVSVNDSQIEPNMTNSQIQAPRFSDFRSSNRLALRDNQTVQYTVATDSVSGHVTKLDVTMAVLK